MTSAHLFVDSKAPLVYRIDLTSSVGYFLTVKCWDICNFAVILDCAFILKRNYLTRKVLLF